MKLVKVLNNNTVIAINDNNEEVIVAGAGLGFNGKKGERINKNVITKIYYVKENEKERVYEVAKNINLEYIKIADSIIDKAQKMLGESLHEGTLLILAQHIAGFIERIHSNQMLTPNLLLNDIKELYPKEYEIGVEAVEMIQNEFEVTIPKDEIGFISLHIVNGRPGYDASEFILIREFIKDINQIIMKYYPHLDIESRVYNRLQTHINFFAKRIIKQEQIMVNHTNLLYPQVFDSDTVLKACIDEIYTYIYDYYNYQINDEEQLYLSIHLKRIP